MQEAPPTVPQSHAAEGEPGLLGPLVEGIILGGDKDPFKCGMEVEFFSFLP